MYYITMKTAWAIREITEEVIKTSKQLGVENIIHYGGPGMKKHYNPPIETFEAYKNIVSGVTIWNPEKSRVYKSHVLSFIDDNNASRNYTKN